MSYSVRIKASALKALRRIRKKDRRRLVEVIDRLASEPHAGGLLKGEFAGLRRIRVDRYRIIYEAMDRELVILVVRVADRRDSDR